MTAGGRTDRRDRTTVAKNIMIRSSLGVSLALLALVGCTTPIGQVSPQGYSCGTPSTGHCYAIASVGDHLTGFRTTISVVSNLLGGDGFITNEFWLINYSGDNGWIELGYSAGKYELPKYFWARLDPDSHIYQSHDIVTIPQEEIGTRVTFDVHQTGEDTFVLSVEGGSTHFSTTVTANLWDGAYGGYAHVGQELEGSTGAVASLAMFVDNHVYDQSFNLHLATEADHALDEDVDKPPFGGWMQKPASDNQGGVFATHCCAP